MEVTASAYLDEDEFDSIPDVPPSPLQAHGLEVNLVSNRLLIPEDRIMDR